MRDRTDNVEERDQDFEMPPEQVEAVRRTRDYFNSVNAEGSKRTPKFLWNAKMRFGKTFASYELAKSMDLEFSKQVQRLVMVDFPRALPTQTLTWP